MFSPKIKRGHSVLNTLGKIGLNTLDRHFSPITCKSRPSPCPALLGEVEAGQEMSAAHCCNDCDPKSGESMLHPMLDSTRER